MTDVPAGCRKGWLSEMTHTIILTRADKQPRGCLRRQRGRPLPKKSASVFWGLLPPQTSSTGAQQQIASPEAAPTFPNGTPTMPPPPCVAHPTMTWQLGQTGKHRLVPESRLQTHQPRLFAPSQALAHPPSSKSSCASEHWHGPRSSKRNRRCPANRDTSVGSGAGETNGTGPRRTRGVAPPASWPANCRASNKPTNLLYYTVRGTRRGSDSAVQPYLVSAISILPCSGRLLERGCRLLCGSRVRGARRRPNVPSYAPFQLGGDHHCQIPQMEPPPSGPMPWE